jgi:hypothetical protein
MISTTSPFCSSCFKGTIRPLIFAPVQVSPKKSAEPSPSTSTGFPSGPLPN